MPSLRDEIQRLIEPDARTIDLDQVMRRGRHRRQRVRAIRLTTAIALAIGAILAFSLRGTSGSRLRVAGEPSTTLTSGSPTSGPIVYTDRSKPPPLRVESDGHLLDLTSDLGCWYSADGAGVGRGACATGVVDPARFVVTDATASRLVVSSPLAGTVTASLGPVPPPHTPSELPAFDPTKNSALPVHVVGGSQWTVDLPAGSGPSAIYLTLRVDPGNRSASGEAYYGFELLGR